MNLSPSAVHRHLLSQVSPSLRMVGSDFDTWKNNFRSQITELIRQPKNQNLSLNIVEIWSREHALGTIKKIKYSSEPHNDVVAYLCTPKATQEKIPYCICLQGHSRGMALSIGVDPDNEDQVLIPEGDRDFGLGCMARGIGALCIEQRAFGQRAEQMQENRGGGTCHDTAMHALALGRTLIGERVLDVDRGLDVLETLDDVDWARVGIMGNSGGGTVSIYAAACLPRLCFAMPSCGFCTFEASIMSIHHCCCNFIPDMSLKADMSDIMGSFAPKPVVVVAGRHDEIFPYASVVSEFERLKNIYRAAGAGDRCQLVTGEGGHRFYAEAAWDALLALINP